MPHVRPAGGRQFVQRLQLECMLCKLPLAAEFSQIFSFSLNKFEAMPKPDHARMIVLYVLFLPCNQSSGRKRWGTSSLLPLNLAGSEVSFGVLQRSFEDCQSAGSQASSAGACRSASICMQRIFQQNTPTSHCFEVQAPKACGHSVNLMHHPSKQPGLLAILTLRL